MWLDELAADVQLPRPRTNTELVVLLRKALSRKLLAPLPLRRAPRLDDGVDLDTTLASVFGTARGVAAQPTTTVGRSCSVSCRASDMYETLGDAMLGDADMTPNGHSRGGAPKSFRNGRSADAGSASVEL